MDLIEVDIVGPEPLQAGVDLGENMLAAEPEAVRPSCRGIVGAEAHLGRDHQVVAALAREPAAEDLLRSAEAVDIGGVDEIAAGLDETVEHFPAERLVGLAAEGHGAQAKLADLEAGPAQKAVFHPSLLAECG